MRLGTNSPFLTLLKRGKGFEARARFRPGRGNMKVTVVNGSPRRKGNTQAMLAASAKELKALGISIESVALAEYEVQPCNGCERCYKKPWDCPIDDDAAGLLRKMRASDGLLIGSPVYFGGVTAQLKALFDRSIMPYQAMELRDKVGGALSCGGGAHGGQELTIMQIVTFFTTHDMVVANCEGGLYGAMGVANDKGEVLRDEEAMKASKNLGRRMAQLMAAMKK